jgi:serine/threonine protein kinase
VAIETDAPWPGDVIGHYKLAELDTRDSVHRFSAVDARNGSAATLSVSTNRFSAKEARQILSALQPATGMRHRHVCGILDAGESGGRIWIASERADGISLEQLLRDEGSLPTAVAARYAASIAAGLQAIHSKGLLHLGLKPASVVVSADDVKVLDVGVSVLVAADGRTFATPTLMAPEQVYGSTARPDVRTDVYALGALLFQALTGVPPFDGKTLPEIVQGILTKTPPRLQAHKPQAAPLEAIVNRALEKRPQARFQSMGELAAALGDVIAAPQAEIAEPPYHRHVNGEPATPPPPAAPPGSRSVPTWSFTAPQPTLIGARTDGGALEAPRAELQNVADTLVDSGPIGMPTFVDDPRKRAAGHSAEGAVALAAPISPAPAWRADPMAMTLGDPPPARITREVSGPPGEPITPHQPPKPMPAPVARPRQKSWAGVIVATLCVLAVALLLAVLSWLGAFSR